MKTWKVLLLVLKFLDISSVSGILLVIACLPYNGHKLPGFMKPAKMDHVFGQLYAIVGWCGISDAFAAYVLKGIVDATIVADQITDGNGKNYNRKFHFLSVQLTFDFFYGW